MGFLFLNLGLNFYLNENADIQHLVTQALQYYSENNKESKSSMLTALKYNNYDQLREVIDWEKWIDSSYMKSLYSYSKLLSISHNLNKKGIQHDVNSDFFLEKLLENSAAPQDKLTFNVDFKVIQPLYATKNEKQNSSYFKNYLGAYQNFGHLKLHAKMQQLQNMSFDLLQDNKEEEQEKKLISEVQQLSTEILETLMPQITLANCFDFSAFSFYKAKP